MWRQHALSGEYKAFFIYISYFVFLFCICIGHFISLRPSDIQAGSVKLHVTGAVSSDVRQNIRKSFCIFTCVFGQVACRRSNALRQRVSNVFYILYFVFVFVFCLYLNWLGQVACGGLRQSVSKSDGETLVSNLQPESVSASKSDQLFVFLFLIFFLFLSKSH